MSKTLLLMLCILTGLLVLACAKTEETNRNVAAPAATNSSAPASTPATTTASAGDKIGIEECDSFLTAYDNCVSNKVPEAVRAQYKNAINTWRTQWKKLADNPQTRGTLVGVCKQQLETARTQVKSFGCTL